MHAETVREAPLLDLHEPLAKYVDESLHHKDSRCVAIRIMVKECAPIIRTWYSYSRFQALPCMHNHPYHVFSAPIEELSTSRPAQCNHTAPVLSFNIPAPIPVPRGTAVSTMPGTSLRLHIEYTRIDPSQADSVTRTPEMIGEEKDASVLFGSTRMEVAMDSLPYTVAAWRMYALRIRLEILGMVSIVWSPYSLPLCINCEDCEWQC